MKLDALDIMAVWRALGGEALRGKRGKAFWRDGDGYSIALDPAKGMWFDHRDARGGGALALVETALGCNRRTALGWLETNCGLDPKRPLSADEYRTYRYERDDAEHFGIAARALAEEVLNQLDACDPGRAEHARLLGIVRIGGAVLMREYRTWLDTRPELTGAMVRAGASSRARVQRRLAFYLLELSSAA